MTGVSILALCRFLWGSHSFNYLKAFLSVN